MYPHHSIVNINRTGRHYFQTFLKGKLENAYNCFHINNGILLTMIARLKIHSILSLCFEKGVSKYQTAV